MDPKMYFAAARRAAGLTVEEAAGVCGVSRPTYSAREQDPMGFRLEELCRLYASLDEVGRELLMRGVNGIFIGSIDNSVIQDKD